MGTAVRKPPSRSFLQRATMMRDETSGENAPGRSAAEFGVRAKARLAIVLERAWPTLLALALVAALFFILAWFGLFALAPLPLRLALLALLACGAGLALWCARGLRLPRESEIIRRIERASALHHQPLQAQADRVEAQDPFALALWHEHQRRMAERLRDLRGGSPDTHTYRLDPLGLRAGVLLLLATAFAFSFGPNGGRVADAFTPGAAPLLQAGARVDAWATPPGYTGRAPIFLTGTGAGIPAATPAADRADAGAPLEVPEGTVLSLRLSDRSGLRVRFDRDDLGEPSDVAPVTREGEGDAATSGAPAATGPGEYELALRESGTVTVEGTLRTLAGFSFRVVPDLAPSVRFDGAPTPGRNNTLDLAYRVSDDYGVVAGDAAVAVLEDRAPGARPLVEAPEIRLALPRRTRGEAPARTSVNVADSPYAGARVELTLRVRDDANQAGASDPVAVTLPERAFRDPLARAVVEQRRILALDANAAPRVVAMLDAVTLRGDEFIRNSSDYLALRAARERIAGATDDDTLRSSVDFLWEIALGIEDGDLSVSERRLREAQDNLAEALREGASDEEIQRLTQELREAMQEFLQAMAEAMRNMPPQMQSEMGAIQEIRPQDLERMLGQIEDLARSGSRDAAQELLSQLNEMMNSLQAMRPGQQGDQSAAQSPMQQQMNQLGEMLQRQQRLMDETFELGRQQARRQMEEERGLDGSEPQAGGEPQSGGGEPMTAQQMQEMMDRLQAEQGRLQQDLQALQEAMREQGLNPSEDFGQAEGSMGEAQGSIGQGDSGEAVGQQGQAMEALRRGAQDAMQQMQQAMGQGEGQGQQPGGQQPGGTQMGQGTGPGQQRGPGQDPLGRQRQTQGPDFGQDVGVPDEIDIQRARQILDQIRDRLGRPLSPEQERDYLERLLQTP